MKPTQLSIWNKSELDFFVPKRASIKKNKIKKDLTQRFSLSTENKEGYNHIITKEELRQYLESLKEIQKRFYNTNLGVAAMLITSVSQYVNKKKEEITLADMFMMRNSFNLIYSGKEDDLHNIIHKWREANGLKRFGESQYELLEAYVKEFI